MIGKLAKDPFVEAVRHGKAKALFAEVEFPNGDVKTVQLFPGADADTWPMKGDRVIVERAGPVGAFLYAVAAWDGEEPALKPGEREVFSRNKDRKRVARMRMEKDGNVTIDNDAKETEKGDYARVTKGETKVTERGKRTYVNESDVENDIKGDEATTIGGDRAATVKGGDTLEVSGNVTINVTGSATITAGGSVTVSAPTIALN